MSSHPIWNHHLKGSMFQTTDPFLAYFTPSVTIYWCFYRRPRHQFPVPDGSCRSVRHLPLETPRRTSRGRYSRPNTAQAHQGHCYLVGSIRGQPCVYILLISCLSVPHLYYVLYCTLRCDVPPWRRHLHRMQLCSMGNINILIAYDL